MVTISTPRFGATDGRHSRLAQIAALLVLVAVVAVTTWLIVRTGSDGGAAAHVQAPADPQASYDCRPTKLVNYC